MDWAGSATIEGCIRDCREQASTFLCVSEFIRGARRLRLDFLRNKLRVLYNGINSEPCADNVKAERDRNLILFVGRLVEKKGCIYLLRSMPKVKEVCPDARLVVIGDGPHTFLN